MHCSIPSIWTLQVLYVCVLSFWFKLCFPRPHSYDVCINETFKNAVVFVSLRWWFDRHSHIISCIVLQRCCKCHINFFCKASLSTECRDEQRTKICDYSGSQCSREGKKHRQKKGRKTGKEQSKGERRGRQRNSPGKLLVLKHSLFPIVRWQLHTNHK